MRNVRAGALPRLGVSQVVHAICVARALAIDTQQSWLRVARWAYTQVHSVLKPIDSTGEQRRGTLLLLTFLLSLFTSMKSTARIRLLQHLHSVLAHLTECRHTR